MILILIRSSTEVTIDLLVERRLDGYLLYGQSFRWTISDNDVALIYCAVPSFCHTDSTEECATHPRRALLH